MLRALLRQDNGFALFVLFDVVVFDCDFSYTRKNRSATETSPKWIGPSHIRARALSRQLCRGSLLCLIAPNVRRQPNAYQAYYEQQAAEAHSKEPEAALGTVIVFHIDGIRECAAVYFPIVGLTRPTEQASSSL